MDLAYASMLDLLIAAVLIGSVVFGVRKGLIRSAVSLVGGIVALILALSFSSSLGGYIDKNYVNSPMREWLIEQLPPVAEGTTASDIDFDDLFESRPDYLKDVCSFLQVDLDDVAAHYRELKTDGVNQAKSAIITYMVDPFSFSVSRVIAFAVIFAAAMLAILVISLFSKFLNNLPIIRQMDKLGGGILGGITGILFCFILVAIVSTGSKYVLRNKTPSEHAKIRQNTILYKVFYAIDPLQHFFGGAAD